MLAHWRFRLDEDSLQVVPGLSGLAEAAQGSGESPSWQSSKHVAVAQGSWASAGHGAAASLVLGLHCLRGFFQPDSCDSMGRDHQGRSGSLVPWVPDS